MNNFRIVSTGTSNQWNSHAADVLKQYNMAYTENELKECISFDNA